jgi:hypothetical protein
MASTESDPVEAILLPGLARDQNDGEEANMMVHMGDDYAG